MQTIPFLPKYQRYDPEVVHSMSLVYTDLCRTLGMSTTNPATEVVAHKIMEIADRGARTPTAMIFLAMEEFRDGK
jgi:hypothetical protein